MKTGLTLIGYMLAIHCQLVVLSRRIGRTICLIGRVWNYIEYTLMAMYSSALWVWGLCGLFRKFTVHIMISHGNLYQELTKEDKKAQVNPSRAAGFLSVFEQNAVS